jgi:hypothetical protein
MATSRTNSASSSSSRVVELTESGTDEDMEMEDEEEEELVSSSQMPFLTPASKENMPSWLEDVSKELKKQRSGVKKSKKKKLVDDWRFWAGIIVTIGFASAFYTVSQQTGGSFTGFGLPPMSGGGSELVI